jgi:hypothetical protein
MTDAGPLGFEPRPHITEAEFHEVAQRMLLDELERLIVAGHLTQPGLLALRARLSADGEFDPTPRRELLCRMVEDALGMTRHTPDDLAEFDAPPEPT